jgi:hypothetical protein
MDRSTMSSIPDAEGDFAASGFQSEEPDTPTRLGEDAPAPSPPLGRSRTRRSERAAAWSVFGCAGSNAVADEFETALDLEPLGIVIVGQDGASRRLWISASSDCATGAVVDAHLEFRR